ncbi:uncharacterized protein LOC110709495 [Chenopodium quinoa]|uniref:uncharacterized protein LOC110709495 n=1 Tax=Chenopodium quinoa TaxID=63459 RepID=UPI000B78C4D1|nr:uncharacterized protein LOC110709495 [Chenopodium quinoa]
MVPKYKLLLDAFLNKTSEESEFCAPSPKCDDPGLFSIHCRIGKAGFHECVLDLGSSVNILPTSMYDQIELGPLKSTNEILYMANGNSVSPNGCLENVLIQVKHLFFLVDFYVINMENISEILLGRPFLKTAKALIDVANGSVTLGNNGQTININVFDEQGSLEESGATNHVSYHHAQIAVENVEMLLDEMVNNVGLEQLLFDALNELCF